MFLVIGHADGPNIPLEVVNVLLGIRLKSVKGPDVLADAINDIVLEGEPTDELVNGRAVDLMRKAQLIS